MDGIFSFFDFINDWLNDGIYVFFTEFLALFVKKALLEFMFFVQYVIPFAWGIAKVVLEDLSISSRIDSAWGLIDAGPRSWLYFFRLPEVLNNIVMGFTTRFVLRFIPFV